MNDEKKTSLIEMDKDVRNSEAKKLLKDPYDVLGIGYTQFY
jgi:hypothetical protein